MTLFAVALVACNDDSAVSEVDLGYLKLVSSDVDFGYKGRTGEIVVDTKAAVTAKSADSWATVSVNGNVVEVTVPDYSAVENRNTSVTVSADGRSVVVPVSQGSFAIMLASTTLTFPDTGGSNSVEFTPNDVTVSAVSDQAWVTVSAEAGVATVTASANDGAARTATVTLAAGTRKATFTVTQDAHLAVSPTSGLRFAYNESTGRDITYETTADVTVTSSQSWAKATLNAAAKTITVTVTENEDPIERVATITVAVGTLRKAVAVIQAGVPLDALTWEVWANGTWEGNSMFEDFEVNTTKTTTLSKAAGKNVFRIDSPYVEGYHFAFMWDIDNRAEAIGPVGIFNYAGLFPVQSTGIDLGEDPIPHWITDTDDMWTYYDPAEQAFCINSMFGGIEGTTVIGTYFQSSWEDDYFTITKFLKGNPRE